MRGLVPPIRIYIHIGFCRLGGIAVNQFNQPYRGTGGVFRENQNNRQQTILSVKPGALLPEFTTAFSLIVMNCCCVFRIVKPRPISVNHFLCKGPYFAI